jgi:hypothetical protein
MTTEDIQTAESFFRSIGIETTHASLDGEGCVPGISCREGRFSIDEIQLAYAGDLFYVAGRIAVTAPEDRDALDDRPKLDAAEEMAALAWAFAAANHLGIPAEEVFHESGYHGQGRDLAAQFASGSGPGVPMLNYYGMGQNFPQLTSWLRPTQSYANQEPS